MRSNCGFLLALFLFIGGCSSSKRHDNGTVEDAAASNPHHQMARDDQPPGTGATLFDRTETGSSEPPNHQSILEDARTALGAGEYESAGEKVRTYLLAHPSDVMGLFLAAQIEAACERYLAAVALLDEIPRDHPQAGLAALGQSADWMLAAHQWDESERRYNVLLNKVPTFNVAHRRLAYLLNRQGRRQEASEHVRFLCRAGDVTQSELHTLIDECEAIYDEDRDSDSSVSRFAPIGPQAEARVLFSQKKFKSALDRLRGPMNDGSLRRSGQAFFGRLATEVEDQEAIAIWVERIDEAQKRFGDHWVAQATLLLRDATDIEGAARAFCEAIVRNPTDWIAMSRLEKCMDMMQDLDSKSACHARVVLLKKSFRVNQRVIGNRDPEPGDITKLADLLDELHRPVEAVMWRAVGLGLQDAPQQAFERLETNRQKLLSEVPYPINPVDALAGLELRRFPLPKNFSKDFRPNVRVTKHAPQEDVTLAARPLFPEIGDSVGIDFQYCNARQRKLADLQLYEQFGGGAAAIDYDMDGRIDLYFIQGGEDPKAALRGKSNVLFRNVGDEFTVIHHAGTDDNGYGQGVTSGDWNQDGFPDLVIANFSVNTLFINNGDGTFRQAELGDSWMTPFWTTSVALADVTGDALPDVVEVNYVDDPAVHVVSPRDANGRFTQSRGPESFRAAVDRVFVTRRDGSTKTVRLTAANRSGLGHGLGVVVTDVDGAAGNEIFVGNDTDPNHLWALSKKSPLEQIRFTNLARIRGCANSSQAFSGASMGIAVGDFDRNGMIDFHVTNFYEEPVHVYLQNQNRMFNDSVIKSDLYQPSLHVTGFGTQALDYDNNGTLDLAIVNGHIDDFRYKGVPHKMLPQLFAGMVGRFVEVDVEGSDNYWKRPTLGRALIKLDWNRDGRMDLLATHHDVPAALLENQTESENNWIQFRLVGTVSERDAIGARVTIRVSGQDFVDVVTAGDGYVCKNESIVAFGLGRNERIERLRVRWPTGKTQDFKVPAINRRYLVVEQNAQVFADH